MTIPELAAWLAIQTPADMLRLLAEAVPEARTETGALSDASDFRQWLLELSKAARAQEEWREVS